jgi:hypothetical protein
MENRISKLSQKKSWIQNKININSSNLNNQTDLPKIEKNEIKSESEQPRRERKHHHHHHFRREGRENWKNLSPEERMKRIEEKINFLQQKISEVGEDQERKQRMEMRISRLSQRKSWIQNKIKPISSQISQNNEIKCETEQPRKERCHKQWKNRHFQSSESKGEKVEEPRRNKEEWVKEKINKLNQLLLNKEINEKRKQKILFKIEFLSQKISQSSQNKEKEEKEKENISHPTRGHFHRKFGRFQPPTFQSKESHSRRLEFLEKCKQNVKEKINQLGNKDDFLKQKLSYKLEKIENKISFLKQKNQF